MRKTSSFESLCRGFLSPVYWRVQLYGVPCKSRCNITEPCRTGHKSTGYTLGFSRRHGVVVWPGEAARIFFPRPVKYLCIKKHNYMELALREGFSHKNLFIPWELSVADLNVNVMGWECGIWRLQIGLINHRHFNVIFYVLEQLFGFFQKCFEGVCDPHFCLKYSIQYVCMLKLVDFDMPTTT